MSYTRGEGVPALGIWRLTPYRARTFRNSLSCRLLRYQHLGTWKSGVTWGSPIGKKGETRRCPAKAGDCQLRRGRLQGRILVEPVQHERMAKPRPGNWDTRAGWEASREVGWSRGGSSTRPWPLHDRRCCPHRRGLEMWAIGAPQGHLRRHNVRGACGGEEPRGVEGGSQPRVTGRTHESQR